MNKFLKQFLLLQIFVLLSMLHLAQAEDETPDRIVRDVINHVLKVLDDPEMDENHKRLIVSGLVSEHISFEEMSRRVLAVHWKQATDSQKIEFIDLFRQNLLYSYWVRIRQYSGEKVKYLATSYDQLNLATVDTVIERDNNEVVIPVTYRMKFDGEQWLVFDFLVENLSLVQNYQREYSAIIKNNGIDGLLTYMKRELQNLR